MATLSKSLLFAGTYASEGIINNTSSVAFAFLAPYTFVDSATPLTLTAFPFSTAVTVGQKFSAPSSGYGNDRFYFEIITAGTTGTSWNFTTDTSRIVANKNYTSGTAVFRPRAAHGWAQALAGYDSKHIATFMSPVTWLVASGATVASTRGPSGTFGTDSYSQSLYLKNALFSVSKASGDRPTTYAAGATLTRSWSNASQNVEGVLWVARGVTLRNTAPETDSTTSGLPICGLWETGRYMDCTFQVPCPSEVFYNTRQLAHTGTYRALRCTFSNTATTGTYSQPVFGSDDGTYASADAPTFTRARVSTGATDPILTALGNTYSSSNAYAGFDIVGGDLSGLAQTSYAPLPAATYNIDGYVGVTYGTNFNATYPPLQANADGAEYVGPLAKNLYSGAGSTAYDRYDYVSKSRTITRSSGANDGGGAFSLKIQMGHRIAFSEILYFMNTRVTEGFTLSFDLQYSAATGISGLTEEDVWFEALYFDTTDTRQMKFVSSIQNRSTRPALFPTGPTAPRALPTSASTWAGSLASAVKHRMSAIVNPRRAGPIVVRFGVWMSPKTRDLATPDYIQVYICPKPILSAA